MRIRHSGVPEAGVVITCGDTRSRIGDVVADATDKASAAAKYAETMSTALSSYISNPRYSQMIQEMWERVW